MSEDTDLQSTDAVVLLQRIAREMTVTRRLVSEALNGMRKAEFQKSKTDVLDWIAALIRVPLSKLAEQASGTPLRMAG